MTSVAHGRWGGRVMALRMGGKGSWPKYEAGPATQVRREVAASTAVGGASGPGGSAPPGSLL